MENCKNCGGNKIIIDYKEGDTICTTCGVVQMMSMWVYEEINENKENESIIEEIVYKYGHDEGMVNVIELMYEDYKKKSGKSKVYNKEYIIVSLLMRCMRKQNYEHMSEVYELEVKMLKKVHRSVELTFI